MDRQVTGQPLRPECQFQSIKRAFRLSQSRAARLVAKPRAFGDGRLSAVLGAHQRSFGLVAHGYDT